MFVLNTAFLLRQKSLLLVYQVVLECSKFLRHRYTLFFAFHKGLQFGRNFNRFTDNSFHRILELGRMGCFQENTRFARLQSFGQSTITAGTMRVEQIVVCLPYVLHRFGYLFVGISGSADISADGGMAIAIKVEYAGKRPWRWQWWLPTGGVNIHLSADIGRRCRCGYWQQ